MALQSIIMPIISLFKSAGITQARSALFGLNKDFTHFAQTVGKAAASFAAFQGLAGAREFLVNSVEQTQRFERNMLALTQVFEGATPQLRMFTKEVESYGLSQAQAAQASVFLGSVLKQYGFSTQESADQTERLVRLAQDLATTYGYDVQESLLAITALFRGEYDPIEKFGVAMKQNEINAELAARGLDDLTGAAEMQAAAQIRLELLFERAGDSIGAYSRASDTLYVAQQNLAAVITNLQTAFGSPLQEPIANVINQFAELVQNHGPALEEIGVAIGDAINNLAPLVLTLGESFFQLLQPLEQGVKLLNAVGTVTGAVVTPALSAGNQVLDVFNAYLDLLAARTNKLNYELRDLEGPAADFLRWANESTIINWENENTLQGWARRLRELAYNTDDAAAEVRDAAQENYRFELQAQRSSEAVQRFRDAVREANPPLTFFQSELQLLGVYSKDAEGNLTGLAAIFATIQEEAQKSKAREELEALGVAAGAIEEIINSVDWQTTFGQISAAARIAAMDMYEAFATYGAGAYYAAVAAVAQINKAFTPKTGGTTSTNTGATETARDFVAEFFTGIEDEMAKQSARLTLAGMGASEALIESIVGAANWEEVFDAVIAGGVSGLEALQAQFNLTGEGLAELAAEEERIAREAADAAEAAAREAEKAAREAQKALEEATRASERALDELNRTIADLEESFARLLEEIESFKVSVATLAIDSVLNTYDRAIGRFEASAIKSFQNIEDALLKAFENGLIFERSYNELLAYARQEGAALQAIARRRDELAAKADWVEGLLRDYRSAFTGALQLTNLLSGLEQKTQEITVTQIQEGMVQVGSTMKMLRTTLSKTYTETLEETSSAAETLVDHFRNISERAKQFAANLIELRRLGLDPELFNQIVQAGVEAGGETAQALVEGGAEAINEINSLFQEIAATGVSIGEYVAEDFYSIGEDFASQLLDGIRSQQAYFEELAKQMSKAFQDNFNVGVGEATQQVADVTEMANKIAELSSKIQFWQTRIGEEEAKLATGTLGPNARDWANRKIESYNNQIQTALNTIDSLTAQMNAITVPALANGGIALGQVLATIGEKGPEAVIPLDKLDMMMNGGGGKTVVTNYYTINASGYSEGQKVVDALKRYQTQNGPFTAALTGFGA